ncbi:MAG: (5-formylfuran-3-yl)methyl phosphate synthase [Pirellulales bacterium]
MTRLLVSVRDAAEAEIACRAGVDLVDVKEPTRGSLGAADIATIEAIVRVVAGRRPISVALGDVPTALALPPSLAAGVRYGKTGLAGCRDLPPWREYWHAAIERLPKGVAPVAVIYADAESAAAPPAEAIIDLAIRRACRAVLIDTFDKSRGSLFAHLDQEQIAALVDTVRGAGLQIVLAGSLGLKELERVLPLAPDFVGVRGAACAGDRAGTIDEARVRGLVHFVHKASRRSVASTR